MPDIHADARLENVSPASDLLNQESVEEPKIKAIFHLFPGQ